MASFSAWSVQGINKKKNYKSYSNKYHSLNWKECKCYKREVYLKYEINKSFLYTLYYILFNCKIKYAFLLLEGWNCV